MKIMKFNNWEDSIDDLKKALEAITFAYGEYVVCLESTDQIEVMREFVRAKSHIEVFDVNKLSENNRYETQGHSYCVLVFLCGEEALEYIGKQEIEIPEEAKK